MNLFVKAGYSTGIKGHFHLLSLFSSQALPLVLKEEQEQFFTSCSGLRPLATMSSLVGVMTQSCMK